MAHFSQENIGAKVINSLPPATLTQIFPFAQGHGHHVAQIETHSEILKSLYTCPTSLWKMSFKHIAQLDNQN